MNNVNYITTGKATNLLGLSKSTLFNYIKSGTITGFKRSPTGRYLFNKQELLNLINPTQDVSQTQKRIIYARVSSKKQKDDLDRQIEFLRTHRPDYQVITDIGSGINFNRKGLKTILEQSMLGNVKEVVVAYKDRLSRFAFDLIKQIIEFNQGTITVLHNEEFKSPEQELSDDLLSIIHVFSCKKMGKRKYKIKNSKDSNIS